MKIIDISVPLSANIPIWPGSHGFSQIQTNSISNGCQSNMTVIDMDIHVGTHIDAPFHFLMEGKTIDKIPLNELCGDAFVLDARDEKIISEMVLIGGNIPQNTKRLLIKTNNGYWWKQKSFNQSYVGLSANGAQWLVDYGIKLIGIDYLSVANFDEIQIVHEILLKKDCPEFDNDLAKEEEIVLGVQVNGKRRGEIKISIDATEEEVKDLAIKNPEVSKWLEGDIKKVVYVKGRILNFIV